jgi:hypothetical protein
MRRIAGILILAALWVVAAAGADVSGKWSGTFKMTAPDGESRESTAVLILKQTGSDITGSAGPDESEQHAIAKGKIVGDKITLETDDGVKLDLVLTGERIAGEVTITREGETRKAKLDVARAK